MVDCPPVLPGVMYQLKRVTLPTWFGPTGFFGLLLHRLVEPPCFSVSAFGSLGQPLLSMSDIRANAFAVRVGTTEIVLGLSVSSLSSTPQPVQPLGGVLLNAISIEQHHCKIRLGFQIATQGCLPVEADSTGSIAPHACALIVE